MSVNEGNFVITNTPGNEILLNAHQIQEKMGWSRSLTYNMLNRSDLPVVKIGGRKFMHAELFYAWLKKQAEAQSK